MFANTYWVVSLDNGPGCYGSSFSSSEKRNIAEIMIIGPNNLDVLVK